MRGEPAFVKRNAIVLRYLLSYLAASAIVLACTGYTYYEAQRILVRDIEQFNLSSMAGIRDLVDNRLSEIEATIHRVASYHMTNRVLHMDTAGGTANMYQLKEYAGYLRNVEAHTSPAFSLTVYLRRSGYVVGDGAASRYPAYYKEVLQDSEDPESSQWFRDLHEAASPTLRPRRTIYLSGVPSAVIPCVQTIPPGRSSSLGAVCIFIDHDDLFSGMVQTGSHRYSYILGPDSGVLTTLGGGLPAEAVAIPEGQEQGFFTQSVGGEKMIVVFVKSRWNLTFVTVTPFSIVMGQSRDLRGIFLLSVAVCSLLCVATAVLFVRKNAVPVTAVYRMLTEHVGAPAQSGSKLDYIRVSVGRLVEDNIQLQEVMERQTGEMQVAYLSRLLTGGVETGKEMQASMDSAGLREEGALYVVATLRILYGPGLPQGESAAELRIIKARIRQALEPARGCVIPVDTAANQLALVFHFPADAETYCRNFVRYAVEDLQAMLEESGVELLASAGSPRTRLSELYHAYHEANLTAAGGSGALHWYEESRVAGEIFHYPAGVEQRITACMRGSEVEELSSLLDAVIHENCENLRLSDSMGDLLVAQMKATLLRHAKEFYSGDPAALSQLAARCAQPHALPLRTALGELKPSFLRLCEEAAARGTGHTQLLRQECLRFIDEHFADPAMSLTMVASRFHLSESYFSAFFKKHTGENFLSYVAAKRLELSCALLGEGQHTVEEIAKLTGYTTAHSFRRAFKNRYGISPAAYQKEKEQ